MLDLTFQFLSTFFLFYLFILFCSINNTKEMSHSAYYRLKKHRQFKRCSNIETIASDGNSPMEIDVPSNSPSYPQSIDSSEHTDTLEHDDYNYSNYFDNNSSNLSDSSFGYSDRSPDGSLPDHESPRQSPNTDNDELNNILTKPSFREKLQDWAVKHKSNLTVEIIEDLLGILRAENIPNLPKSATTLLQTKSNTNIKLMNSLKNTTGFYMYLGIEQSLRDIITEEYSDTVIRLLFNIDGLPLFNGSNQQFWPNLGLILHNDYDSQPFIVSVYSGDSKPQNIDYYLEDYVKEAKHLIQNGVTIGQITFRVEIVGFSCDTPARSFVKKCKGHGGFYACERCETRGKTINKKRVYPNMTSRLRTKSSFITKSQNEHHLGAGTSPLLGIPDFDPVKSIFLDSMHLLYLGVMKWIMYQLLGTKKFNKKCKLPVSFKFKIEDISEVYTKRVSKKKI